MEDSSNYLLSMETWLQERKFLVPSKAASGAIGRTTAKSLLGLSRRVHGIRKLVHIY